MSRAPSRVLFVCVENSCRSQIAEAFARIHGMGRIEAYSAGSRPSGQVHPVAIESMRELGYDLTGHHSKSLDEIPRGKIDYVITMGCGDTCPWIAAEHREDWEIPDPKALGLEQFRDVRRQIEEKVLGLIATLARQRV